jgi:signal transduction histidine kinase/ActR/RegA family two-component response regulator
MRAGANDYIMKDRLKRLGLAVKRELAHTEERRRKRESDEEKVELEMQLHQSHKMEAMGILAGGIAHDFNNLLYPIFIHTSLLLEQCDVDDPDYANLKEITNAAQLAKDLVSQVLIFSRRSDNIKHVCDVVPIVKGALKLVRTALAPDITIDARMPDGIVPVLCDSTLLYQVLINICTNSGQAMPGGGRIEITLDSSSLNGIVCVDGTELHGDFCRLTVTDSGIGMDEETRTKLFDPFFTTREVGRGTGLGLSVVFGIVHDHGGGITVSSEAGNGTTIEVFLPLSDQSLDVPLESLVDDQDSSGSERILIVDDEKLIRNSVEICLTRVGYSVTTAASGREALDLFAKDLDQFDIVMTDQSMPDMTGEQLAAALLELKPGIPIILCSGRKSTVPAEDTKASGISASLQKPLTPEELRRAVRKALNEASV